EVADPPHPDHRPGGFRTTTGRRALYPEVGDRAVTAGKRRSKSSRTIFPPGWDERRVGRGVTHYEGQPAEEDATEDEEALESAGNPTTVPVGWAAIKAKLKGRDPKTW